MKCRISVAVVAVLACVAFSSQAFATVADCKASISKDGGKQAAGITKNIVKCDGSVIKGKLPATTDCVGAALLDAAGTVTAEYKGKIKKGLDKTRAKLAAACAGIGPLDFSTSGVKFHAWGSQLDQDEDLFNGMENQLEEDCITNLPINQYNALTSTERLIANVECLEISTGIAGATINLSANTNGGSPTDPPRISRFKSPIVPVAKLGITYDGGYDTPSPATDGINDQINVPSGSGCPLPGIGACAADPNITCNLVPGSVADPFSTACPLSGGACTAPPSIETCCVEGLVGPDGITAGDAPTETMTGGKCMVTVKDDPSGGAADSIVVKCMAEGITAADTAPGGTCAGGGRDGLACTDASECDRECSGGADDGNPCVTDVDCSDVCSGGPSDGGPCNTDTDCQGLCKSGVNKGNACSVDGDCPASTCDRKKIFCDNDAASCSQNTPSAHACNSGDEFICQLEGVTGSNPDGSPACGPCLIGLLTGGPGDGCGVGGGGLCAVATCSAGSVRPGQACDITGVTGCPGGFCDGVAAGEVLTGDEVGFFAPAFGGMAYLQCPVKFRLDFPGEVNGGAFVAISDLTAPPLSICLPSGNAVQAEGCFLHQPPPGGDNSDFGLVEFYTGGDGLLSSNTKLPCPDAALPLPGGNTGLPTQSGNGPVIGVTGISGN